MTIFFHEVGMKNKFLNKYGERGMSGGVIPGVRKSKERLMK